MRAPCVCKFGNLFVFSYNKKPAPPERVCILNFTARSVYLQWSPPTFTGYTDILGYNINLRNNNTTFRPVQSNSSGPCTTTSVIFNVTNGITPYTTYEFAVAACNKVGCSDLEPAAPVRTNSAGECCGYMKQIVKS